MKKVDPYIDAMLLAIAAIESYTPKTDQQLQSDQMRTDAILMRLQELGEIMYTVCQKYEEEFFAHGTDQWHKVIGLRHIISHEYGSLDLNIIWNIICDKLPELEEWY